MGELNKMGFVDPTAIQAQVCNENPQSCRCNVLYKFFTTVDVFVGMADGHVWPRCGRHCSDWIG